MAAYDLAGVLVVNDLVGSVLAERIAGEVFTDHVTGAVRVNEPQATLPLNFVSLNDCFMRQQSVVPQTRFSRTAVD